MCFFLFKFTLKKCSWFYRCFQQLFLNWVTARESSCLRPALRFTLVSVKLVRLFEENVDFLKTKRITVRTPYICVKKGMSTVVMMGLRYFFTSNWGCGLWPHRCPFSDLPSASTFSTYFQPDCGPVRSG